MRTFNDLIWSTQPWSGLAVSPLLDELENEARRSILDPLNVSRLGKFFMRRFIGMGWCLSILNSPQNYWISLDQTGTSRFHFWWKCAAPIEVGPNTGKLWEKSHHDTHSGRGAPFDPHNIMIYGPKDFGIEDRRRGRERRQSNRWIQKLRSGENNQRCFRGEFQICAIS